MDDDLLVGRYQRLRSLGSGGMGDVWLAEDLELGRRVAVKRLRFGTPAGLDAELVERMTREARVVARLNHPAVVTLHDLVRVEGRPFLIMEYVEGESLAERIVRQGALPWAEVAPVVADIAGALAAAHRAGVLHRDVKPANVLLDPEGGGHLADFGIARGSEDAVITRAGELVGTVAYMPPEVARDNHAEAASDVWSLGATFFAAVEGRAPFADSGASVPSIINRLINDEAPPPTRAGPCGPLLTRMLASDPAARPGAADVAAELRRLLAAPVAPPAAETRESPYLLVDQPTQATQPPTRYGGPAGPANRSPGPGPSGPSGPPGPPPSRPRRRTWPLLVAGLLVAAVVAGGGYLLLTGDDDGGGGTTTSGSRPEPPGRFGTVDVGANPSRLEVSPDGLTSYVANTDDDTLSIIDNRTGATEPVGVCDRPRPPTVAPDGATVYVPCVGGGVSAVDTATGEATTIPVDGEPGPVTVTDDSATLLVPTPGAVQVVDTESLEVRASIPVDGNPGLIHLAPGGTTGYAPSGPSSAVAVIDLASDESRLIPVDPQPNGLQVTADGTRVVVTTEDDEAVVLDPATGEEVARVGLEHATDGRVRLSPDDAFAWLPDPDGEQVWVFDTTTGRQVADVDVGGTTPIVVTFDPGYDTVYIADQDGGGVVAIDTRDYTTSLLRDTGPPAQNTTISPDGRTLYVVGWRERDPSRGTVTAVPLD